MRSELLYGALSRRILILDGAMGTMLQAFRLGEQDFRGEIFKDHPHPLAGDNDVLCLTRPDLVRTVHRQYLEAGADIIETNSFNANAVSQKEYGLEDHVYRIARAAAECAAAEAAAFSLLTPDKPRFTAGSVGPTSCTLSMSPSVADPAARALSFDEMVLAFKPQIEGLIDGGADILLFETIFDTLNAKAASYAASLVFEERKIRLPVMFSGTVSDASGRLLAGQTAESFLISLEHIPGLLSVGFNCALGAAEMRPHIELLAREAPCFVSAHPNAGLPDEQGHYHQTPENMAAIIRSCAEAGLLNIVGGCCGTTPAYIRAVADAVAGLPPRKVPPSSGKLRLSGLDPVMVSEELPFLNIGERANVAGSRKFLNLMKEGNIAEGLRICRSQAENGAQVLDVNMDDAMLDSEAVMRTFLRSLAAEPDIARVPLMIDSSRWDVIRTGLRNAQGKCIVNSISLKEGEGPFLEKAREARRFGAAVLCMAFDEQGQADTLERRVNVCRRMYKLLTEEIGMPPEDIIFDPNVFAVATGMPEHDSCARDFIEAVRIIKKEMPLCSLSGGISNVSFSFRGNEPVRRALHSVFLYHAVKAGLGMAIVNPAQLDIYDEIEPALREAAEAVILNTSPDAGEKLLSLAAGIRDGKAKNGGADRTAEVRRSGTLEERLAGALVRGDDTFLEADLAEALQKYEKAVSIIEGPLMDGMRETGRLFGEGKMFLPQVVKTARTMKRAVDILMPGLAAENTGASAGTVVLATVKGDVHDIGKNIVSVILRCNNYHVIDLGVMTPAGTILDTAEREHADAVALSGLITPSLGEMERVAAEMEKRGMKIPLFVGGATTSEEHTALRIQKCYSGLCIQTGDASAIVPALNAALHPEKDPDFLNGLKSRYAAIRRSHGAEEPAAVSVQEHHFKVASPSPTPKTTGPVVVAPDFYELVPDLDWNEFCRLWGVHARTEEARNMRAELRRDAERLLLRCPLHLKGVFGIFPVSAGDDTVAVQSPDRSSVLETLHFPRREKPMPDGTHPSLADFLTDCDYLGMFALSAGFGVREEAEKLLASGDEYSALLLKILAEVAAEAFAQKLHGEIRNEYWGCPPSRKTGIRAAPGYPSCPDHTLKKPLFRLLDAEKNTGIRLTENCMMDPAASICAFLFAAPGSFYF